MRTWNRFRTDSLQAAVANPQFLTLLFVADVAAYFGGLLFWYAYVMADPSTPVWTWAFIPDCPLFGLLGGIGLLMVTAKRFWKSETCRRTGRWLVIAAACLVLLSLIGFVPGIGAGWVQHRAMFCLLGGVLLLSGVLFRRAPNWLLGIFAFGQIKYGIWTVTAWSLFWINTAELLGAPLYTPDSILMTVTHVGLIAQGLVLLTYFRPTVATAAASLAWFAASDFVDYGLGFYPALPEDLIPVSAMQWSTVAVTLLLAVAYLWSGASSQFSTVGRGQRTRPSNEPILYEG